MSKKTVEGDDDVFATSRSKSALTQPPVNRAHATPAPRGAAAECAAKAAILYAPCACAGKKSRGNRANRGAGPVGAADAKAAQPRVQHDIETLGLLASLQLPVPKTAAEVEEVAATVKARKAEYEAKQKRKLAGEDVSEDDAQFDRAGGGSDAAAKVEKPAAAKAGGKRGVALSIKCDEAFNMVLVELTAH